MLTITGDEAGEETGSALRWWVVSLAIIWLIPTDIPTPIPIHIHILIRIPIRSMCNRRRSTLRQRPRYSSPHRSGITAILQKDIILM